MLVYINDWHSIQMPIERILELKRKCCPFNLQMAEKFTCHSSCPFLDDIYPESCAVAYYNFDDRRHIYKETKIKCLS